MSQTKTILIVEERIVERSTCFGFENKNFSKHSPLLWADRNIIYILLLKLKAIHIIQLKKKNNTKVISRTRHHKSRLFFYETLICCLFEDQN